MSLEELQKQLLGANYNDHTEKKNGLTYLSWAWAWSEAIKADPNANYEIVTFDGVPYKETPLGIMCYTKVTMLGTTRTMWLPVMDSRNQALKTEAYKNSKGYNVPAADMFDINKTIMRCLVKNLAMFGLGIYIYAGEDLPEELSDEKPTPKKVDPSKGFTLKEASDSVKSIEPSYEKEIKELIDRLAPNDVISASDWFSNQFGHDWKHATASEADVFKSLLERKLGER